MKLQVTKFSIIQSSKIVTLLYALFGMIYVPLGILGLVFGEEPKDKIGAVFLILGPLWSSILGFVFFAFLGALYNFLAKWVGGIEVHMTDVTEPGSFDSKGE
ncbi:MAG: hypothetical protein P8L18_08220 [Verrucomicrobiota bacterium]|jgi:hypothetical protein|nr:hypothetical protein [Verrucomicrobiota bacterium]